MKYTVKEFAKQIRDIYPNDYNDLTDETLVNLWLKKYPKDILKVEVNAAGKPTSNDGAVGTSSSGCFPKLLKYAFWIAILGGGIYFTVQYFIRNNSSLDFSNTNATADSSTEENATPINVFDNITIDPIISERVDSTLPNILDNDQKSKLKKILSDPNPDPENKKGEYCGSQERKCKWCSNIFKVNGFYTTIQDQLNRFGDSSLSGFLFMLYLGSKDEFLRELDNGILSYENGNKYDCVYEDTEFCSEKCRVGWKYSH